MQYIEEDKLGHVNLGEVLGLCDYQGMSSDSHILDLVNYQWDRFSDVTYLSYRIPIELRDASWDMVARGERSWNRELKYHWVDNPVGISLKDLLDSLYYRTNKLDDNHAGFAFKVDGSQFCLYRSDSLYLLFKVDKDIVISDRFKLLYC